MQQMAQEQYLVTGRIMYPVCRVSRLSDAGRTRGSVTAADGTDHQARTSQVADAMKYVGDGRWNDEPDDTFEIPE